MGTAIVRRNRRLIAPSMSRNLGLRRAALRERWYDTTTYLLSNPANAKWIMDAKTQLDHWREMSGEPPFDPSYSIENAP